jgi:hypothetical protein
MVSPIELSDDNYVRTSHVSHAYYTFSLSHSPWLDHRRRIQFMNLLIMYFSPMSYYFLSLRIKYPSHHLFSCTSDLRSFHNVKDRCHTHTKRKVLWFCIVTRRGDLQEGFLDLMTGFVASTTFTHIRTTGNYSAIAILHTFQFTAANALRFPVFTSHIPATDLSQSHCNFKSHAKYSCHSLIPFLPFLLNHLRLPSPELNPIFD